MRGLSRCGTVNSEKSDIELRVGTGDRVGPVGRRWTEVGRRTSLAERDRCVPNRGRVAPTGAERPLPAWAGMPGCTAFGPAGRLGSQNAGVSNGLGASGGLR